MGIIRKENDVKYTNSEFYDKRKSDNLVIIAFLSLLIIGGLFYTYIYSYFNSSSELKYFPHVGSVIVFIISSILLYKAKKQESFFTNRVLFLPLFFVVYLTTCIYLEANNKFGGDSFSTYINTNVVETQKIKHYVDELKSSIDKYFNIEEI